MESHEALIELARKTYEKGIKPRCGAGISPSMGGDTACILDAILYQNPQIDLDFYWKVGCTHGFDGLEKSILLYPEHYNDGYEFGKKAAAIFLTA